MGANVQGEMFEYHLRSCILCAGYIMIQVKPKSVSECLQDFSEDLDDLGHLHMHFSCSFHDKIVSQTENILPWKVSVFLKHMKLMLYSTKMVIILLEINKTYHSLPKNQTSKSPLSEISYTLRTLAFLLLLLFFYFFNFCP